MTPPKSPGHDGRHEDLEELVPLLAIDALTADEELSVRAHVEGCSRCATLLREHLETAGDLALLTEPVAPPPGLRDRLMARIATEPQTAPAAVAVGAPAASAGPARGAGAPAGGKGRGWPSWLRVVPSPRWRGAIAGLAAACVVLAGVNLAITRRAADQDRQIAQQQRILDLISGPPAITMQPAAPGIQATGHVFVKDGQAAIVLTGLDDTPDGVYEVWVIRGGKPAPLASVSKARWEKEKGQAVVVVNRGVEGAEGMAVSLEPSPPPPDATAPRGRILLKT